MRILLITLRKWWLGVSRLPLALTKAGFEVGAWCPDESFLARTDGVTRHFPWNGSEKWSSRLAEIVAEWKPDLIVPGDETIAHFLRKVASQSALLHPGNAEVRKVLLRSLGNPKTTGALDGKIGFQRMAAALGLRTPDDRAADSVEDAVRIARELTYPVVLKDEFAAGGAGVKICASEEVLRTSWAELEGGVAKPKSAKDRIRQILDNLRGKNVRRRSLQRFIQGRPAFHAVAALGGKRLGGVTAIVEMSDPPGTGPSTVVRLCEVPEISDGCRKIIEQTGLSGFAGFDFMVEDGTGKAFVLECNPRPTPASHLGDLLGQDLCAALRDALEGKLTTETAPSAAADDRFVAFYPQEVLRDAASPFLASAYHDVPVDDAGLMAALRERYPALAGLPS